MAETEEEVSFTSPEEEVEYWKEKAMEYRAKLETTLSTFIVKPHAVLFMVL